MHFYNKENQKKEKEHEKEKEKKRKKKKKDKPMRAPTTQRQKKRHTHPENEVALLNSSIFTNKMVHFLGNIFPQIWPFKKLHFLTILCVWPSPIKGLKVL